MWRLAGPGHRRWRRDLSAYADLKLEPGRRAKMEEHLSRCFSCRQELEALEKVVALVRQLPQVPLQRSFLLSHAPAQLAWWGARYTLPLRYATAVVALLLIVIAVGDLVAGGSFGRIHDVTGVPEQQRGVESQAAPAGIEPTLKADTPVPPPASVAVTEKALDAAAREALPSPPPGGPRTPRGLFRWGEWTLVALLAALFTTLAVHWWLGRRARMKGG